MAREALLDMKSLPSPAKHRRAPERDLGRERGRERGRVPTQRIEPRFESIRGGRSTVAPVAVDEDAVARKRRIIKMAIVIVLLAALISIVVLGMQRYSASYQINVLQIEGEFDNQQAVHIQQLMTPYMQQGFFGITLKDAQKTLANVDWVKTAAVSKQWPNALRVKLVERQPIARWGSDQYIDAEGFIFKHAHIDSRMILPVVQGVPQDAKHIAQTWQWLQTQLVPLNLTVVQLTLDDRKAWHAKLSNGIALTLGKDLSIYRLQRFISAFQQHFYAYPERIQTIDLRYANGLSIAWQSGQAPEVLTLNRI
ncbi:MAG: FtsQ-type POTRA domain-containing protein [Gammaproteobacteria bacterium]|nr:FtsQ-type POTRA domain-containing protein [Gammaproteobacteria bacterium]